MDAFADYFKQLTEAELNEHVLIEAELNNSVRGGFSERAAWTFMATVATIRKRAPSAKTENIFDEALVRGCGALLIALGEIEPARKPKRTKRSGVRLET